MKNLIEKIIIKLIAIIIFLGISFLLLYIMCAICNFMLTHTWATILLIIIGIVSIFKLASEGN